MPLLIVVIKIQNGRDPGPRSPAMCFWKAGECEGRNFQLRQAVLGEEAFLGFCGEYLFIYFNALWRSEKRDGGWLFKNLDA